MRPITRVRVDKDSGHAPFYGSSRAYSVAQPRQEEQKTGHSSVNPLGPYAGSGDVLVGSSGIGVHRQFDLRESHIPITQPNGTVPPPESPVLLEGGSFPWLKVGSDTVYVNKQKCGRAGDWTVCGSVVKTGDKTVLVGD